MDKKFQVFVSSTYRDLFQERQEVVQALLELECIPIGMEYFPAADDDQWTLIKGLIEDCDYYLVIVAGRYGSTTSEGVSFTELEYRHAVAADIPILGFIHENPSDISVGKSETDPIKQQKLQDFRILVERKMCKYWNNPSDLGSKVSRSLVKLMKVKPRPGWIRATTQSSDEANVEILQLRKQVELLSAELNKQNLKGPEGAEHLAQGNEKIKLQDEFEARVIDYEETPFLEDIPLRGDTEFTWDEIFAVISPLLIDETTDEAIKIRIRDLVAFNEAPKLKERSEMKEGRQPKNFRISDNDFQTIKIQFRALGLIKESSKKRSVHNSAKYWSLTAYGDNVMTRLRAVRTLTH